MESSNRRTEALLNRLIEAGILKESSSESLSRTGQFQDLVSNYKFQLANKEIESEWVSHFEQELQSLDEIKRVAATALAIESLMPELKKKNVANIAISVQRFDKSVRTEEIPESVTALLPTEIEGFCSRYACSAIIFWKANSESSQLVFNDFAKLTNNQEFENVGVGAVHAPEYADAVRKKYSIGILPTTLFFIGSRVDSRLVGSHHLRTVEHELSIVLERSARVEHAE